MVSLVSSRSPGRLTRVALQLGVSALLILLLVRVTHSDGLGPALASVRPGAVALAVGLYVLASLVNAGRWQLLLRHQGIDESLRELGVLYFIGQFCSLFLPTAAGGDAVRVYEVSRGGRSPWRALLATLQER